MPSDTESDDDSLAAGGLFVEPEGYYKPEKPPTFAKHALSSGETLTLRLVGHNPLWGHLLWNGGQVLSEYLQHNAARLVQGRHVLELGAGAGLPGLVCAIMGSKRVVITDYPDAELVDNIRWNVEHCELARLSGAEIAVEGYLWGNPIKPLLASLPTLKSSSSVPPTAPPTASTTSTTSPGVQKPSQTSTPPVASSKHADNDGQDTAAFDTLILADLLFNHSEHVALVRTLSTALARRPDARALVFFTPYRPWLLQKDLAFFDLVRAAGFVVEKVLEREMEHVMFEEDPGDERLRRTVFGYEVRWDGAGPAGGR